MRANSSSGLNTGILLSLKSRIFLVTIKSAFMRSALTICTASSKSDIYCSAARCKSDVRRSAVWNISIIFDMISYVFCGVSSFRRMYTMFVTESAEIYPSSFFTSQSFHTFTEASTKFGRLHKTSSSTFVSIHIFIVFCPFLSYVIFGVVTL